MNAGKAARNASFPCDTCGVASIPGWSICKGCRTQQDMDVIAHHLTHAKAELVSACARLGGVRSSQLYEKASGPLWDALCAVRAELDALGAEQDARLALKSAAKNGRSS